MCEDLAASLQSISELCIHTTHLNSIHHIILLGSQNPRNRWKVKQVKSGKENIDVKSKVSDINNLCFFKHSLAQNVQINILWIEKWQQILCSGLKIHSTMINSITSHDASWQPRKVQTSLENLNFEKKKNWCYWLIIWITQHYFNWQQELLAGFLCPDFVALH